MARHTPFHDETQRSADAAGDAIDEFLGDPSVRRPDIAAAIATDTGYSQLRWLLKTAIEKVSVPGNDALLADTINQMAEDKSNDWTDEIAVLEGVEQELATLRRKVTTFETHLGPAEDAELRSQYARLGRFFAASLGANEDWDSTSITADGAHLWTSLGHPFPIGGQNEAALAHWRGIANSLGIAHDEPEADAVDSSDLPAVLATVQQEVWVGDYAMPVGDPIKVDVTREVAALSDEARQRLEDNSMEADELYRAAISAGRAGEWSGPFSVHVRDAIDAAYDQDDDLDDDTCAEEDCDNSLDDGQGYDGYCGDHADQREVAGVYDGSES